MTDGGPWVLPIVVYAGVQYFADLRLRQFRNINNLLDSIDFDTEQGRRMCRHNGVVHCRRCGQPNSKGGKYCFKCGSALPQLPASFQKTLEKFNELHSAHQAGELTSRSFQAALKNLMVQDEEGDYWTLGMESGEWYWFDGDEWHLRLPPLILGDQKKTKEESLPAAPEPPKPSPVW